MSYENKKEEITEIPVKLNLKNFMIDENNPIDFDCFVYNNKIEQKKIKLVIRDHYDKNLYCESDVITIV